MSWAAIVTALIQLFGPVLVKWLESLLSRTAKALPAAESFASPDDARDALFDHAITSLPLWMPLRRRLLRRMQAAAGDGVTILPSEEVEHLKTLALAAAHE